MNEKHFRWPLLPHPANEPPYRTDNKRRKTATSGEVMKFFSSSALLKYSAVYVRKISAPSPASSSDGVGVTLGIYATAGRWYWQSDDDAVTAKKTPSSNGSDGTTRLHLASYILFPIASHKSEFLSHIAHDDDEFFLNSVCEEQHFPKVSVMQRKISGCEILLTCMI